MKSNIKIALVFFLAFFVGFISVYVIKNRDLIADFITYEILNQGNDEPIISKTVMPDDNQDVNIPPLAPQAPQVNQLELVVSKSPVALVVKKSEYYYKVKTIKVKGISTGVIYTLSDDFGHVYTSENGNFNNIKVQPNSSATYKLVATYALTGARSETVLKGFYVKTPISNKLTANELTAMIASGDYNDSKLKGKTRGVSISCSNPEFKPLTIAEACSKVLLEGWKVNVTSVNYNCLNEVTNISLSARK